MAGMISARMISARMISAGVVSVGMIWVGILRRVVAALTAIALLMLTGAVHAAPPVEPDQPDFVVLNRDVAPLSPRLRQAVLLDPKVAEATARACQLTHRLGLARAAGRPKVNASISGTRQIKSKIKKVPRVRRVFENGRVRTIKPRGYDEINKTGAHTREFEHDEKNNIYDGKISVRHTFIDWGQGSNRTEARTMALQAARIDALGVMRERSHEMLRLALLLRRIAEVIAVRQDNFTAVQTEVASVRARVEAGVGRMSDLREAQLVALDEEIAINRAQAEYDQIRERLAAEFDLDEADARDLVQTFMSRRPTGLPVLQADRSDKAHAIRLRTREVTHEAAEIRGSRYPKLDGVIEGTIFDMTDYEDEYEIVGKVEITMPLYDGGTARARLRETAWRENELKSSLEALTREHNREMEGLAQQFHQQTREETEALARRDELMAQFRSLQERQGKTVSSPLALARVRAQISAAETRLVELRSDQELIRARALMIAERIDETLGLTMEDSSC
jgi:outer membrane protein TolC